MTGGGTASCLEADIGFQHVKIACKFGLNDSPELPKAPFAHSPQCFISMRMSLQACRSNRKLGHLWDENVAVLTAVMSGSSEDVLSPPKTCL